MTTNNSDFLSIERRLDQVLRPILPEESYSENLKKRLLNNAAIMVEKPDILVTLIFILSILFFGFVFVWIIAKLLVRENE